MQGERVAGRANVLVESLLQVGALLGDGLLEDGRGAGRMGAVGGTACPAHAFSLLSVVFVVALICFVSAFVFAVIVICFKTGLG